jgi:hypothetical protein
MTRKWLAAGVGGVAVLIVVSVITALIVRNMPPGKDDPITDHDARDLLAKVVAAARSGDDQRLCELAQSKLMCEMELEYAKDESLTRPTVPPVVLTSRTQPASVDSREQRVLNLRITTPDRGPYENEFRVMRDDGKLVTITPVYWYRVNWQTGNEDEPDSPS